MDLEKVVFSRYGSYLSVFIHKKSIMVRHVRRPPDAMGNPTFQIDFFHQHQKLAWQSQLNPSHIDFLTPAGQVRLVIQDDETLVIESFGPEVVIKPVNSGLLGGAAELLAMGSYGHPSADQEFVVFSQITNSCTQYKVLQGQGSLGGHNEWLLRFFNRLSYKIIRLQKIIRRVLSFPHGLLPRIYAVKNRQFTLVPNKIDQQRCHAIGLMRIAHTQKHWQIQEIDVDALIKTVANEYDAFRLPATPEPYLSIAQTAWYNLWSCVVRKNTNYQYDAILMSKKFMTSVWSWDHCFNALAISYHNPQMALEQFLHRFAQLTQIGLLQLLTQIDGHANDYLGVSLTKFEP